jgi:hypothetical protein
MWSRSKREEKPAPVEATPSAERLPAYTGSRPEVFDLAGVVQKLAEVDQLRKRIERLEAEVKTLNPGARFD